MRWRIAAFGRPSLVGIAVLLQQHRYRQCGNCEHQGERETPVHAVGERDRAAFRVCRLAHAQQAGGDGGCDGAHTCCRVFIMVEPSAFMRCGSEFKALVWLGDIASGTPIIKIT